MDATSSSPSSTLHYPPGYPSAYIPHPTSTVVVDPHRFSLPPILNNTPVQLVLIFLLLITLALIAAGIYYALRVFRGSTGMSTEGHRNTLPTFATPFRRHPQSPMSSLSSPESLPSSPYLRTPPMDNYMYGVVIPQAAHTKYCGHVLDLRNEVRTDVPVIKLRPLLKLIAEHVR